MVQSSTLTITTDGEHLTCGGLFLRKTIRFGSLEFIIESFGSLSLSPKGSNLGAVFMGTAHSRSPSLCTILKKSTDEFYMASSGEGSSGLPISKRCSMGTPLDPIATTPWPKDAPTPHTMTTIPPWTIMPWPDTWFPPEQWHTFREGQRVQDHTQQADTEHEAAQRRGKLTGKQAITKARLCGPPRHKPMLKVERILMVDLTTTRVHANGVGPVIGHEGVIPQF
jgi:hypothetical protein